MRRWLEHRAFTRNRLLGEEWHVTSGRFFSANPFPGVPDAWTFEDAPRVHRLNDRAHAAAAEFANLVGQVFVPAVVTMHEAKRLKFRIVAIIAHDDRTIPSGHCIKIDFASI